MTTLSVNGCSSLTLLLLDAAVSACVIFSGHHSRASWHVGTLDLPHHPTSRLQSRTLEHRGGEILDPSFWHGEKKFSFIWSELEMKDKAEQMYQLCQIKGTGWEHQRSWRMKFYPTYNSCLIQATSNRCWCIFGIADASMLKFVFISLGPGVNLKQELEEVI